MKHYRKKLNKAEMNGKIFHVHTGNPNTVEMALLPELIYTIDLM